jgi:hypothetical protein
MKPSKTIELKNQKNEFVKRKKKKTRIKVKKKKEDIFDHMSFGERCITRL